MTKIYVPSSGPSAWQALLADPDKHWRTGFSARTLAHCWERANGIPAEVAALFDGPAELLLAIPEHKVSLPGGTRDSQNDVFALLRCGAETWAAAIEGKVNEAFGPTVGEWLAGSSEGKRTRMAFLCETLGLDQTPPPEIRYQLLHRTASALIEASRFKTDGAAMIVHSFSQERAWFSDFAAFVSLFRVPLDHSHRAVVPIKSGRKLLLGWATGAPEFLAA